MGAHRDGRNGQRIFGQLFKRPLPRCRARGSDDDVVFAAPPTAPAEVLLSDDRILSASR
jgi:hypothetical protein